MFVGSLWSAIRDNKCPVKEAKERWMWVKADEGFCGDSELLVVVVVVWIVLGVVGQVGRRFNGFLGKVGYSFLSFYE